MKWSVTLSIMMLAVRANQYQSNPAKTMSDGSTFQKARRIVSNVRQHGGIDAVALLSFGPVSIWQMIHLFGKFESSSFQTNTDTAMRSLRWL